MKNFHRFATACSNWYTTKTAE